MGFCFVFGVFYCLVLIWVGFFFATQAALVREEKINEAGELSKYDHMAAYPSVFFQILLWNNNSKISMV